MPEAGGISKKRGRTASAAPAEEEIDAEGEIAIPAGAQGKGKGKGKSSTGTGAINNKRHMTAKQTIQEKEEEKQHDEDAEEVEDEDMNTARPARKIAKVNAVAAAPSSRINKSNASSSSGLMRTASAASSSGRNGGVAPPNILDDLLAGDASAASPARQAAAMQEVKRAEREVAKLRGQLETNLTAYQKLQEQFDELRDLRHTEAESRVDELTSASNARAEASRQQVNAYAAETEELRQDVKKLRGEIEALREAASQQEGEQQGEGADASMAGSELDEGAGEGDATTFVAETQFPDRHRRPGQSPSKQRHRSPSFTREDVEAPLQAQIAELQAETNELRERLRDSEKARKAQRKEAEEMMNKALSDAEAKHRIELQVMSEHVKDSEAKAVQYEKELAFEMEQSKKKFQAAPAQSQSQIQAPTQLVQVVAQSSTGPSAALQALTAPQHVLTLNTLLLDLVGLTLVSHRVTTALSTVYDFLLTDFKKRKTLHFKFEKPASPSSITDPGATDAMYTFTPEFMRGRDDAVKQCLDESLRNKIQFADPVLPSFFRRYEWLVGNIRQPDLWLV